MLVDVTVLVRSTQRTQQSWALIPIIMFADFAHWLNDSSRTARWYAKARYALMGFEQNSRACQTLANSREAPPLHFERVIYFNTHYEFDARYDGFLSPPQPTWFVNTLAFSFSSALGAEDSSVGIFKLKWFPRIASARKVSCAGKTLERTR